MLHGSRFLKSARKLDGFEDLSKNNSLLNAKI